MSDCFDHEADAWDQHLLLDGDDLGGYSGRSAPFYKDPYYYHSWVNIDGIKAETEKALLVVYGGLSLWIPKSLVKIRKKSQLLVHSEIFSNIIEKAT